MTVTELGRSVLVAMPLMAVATAASAYVGPGAGITAIGTVLALVAAGLLAVVGFVWYPLKRLFGRRRAEVAVERPGTIPADRRTSDA
jgi:hypothetical protein